MATRNDYIIQQQVFDIAFFDKAKAYELQSRFRNLFYQDAIPLMQEAFDELVPAHQYLQWQTLTIDLGLLPYESLEKEFALRFRDALRKQLLQQLNSSPGVAASTGNISSITPVTHTLRLLEFFLSSGTMPWWSSTQATYNSPAALLQQLAAEQPVALQYLLRRVGRQAAVRQRMVYQFATPMLETITGILEPDQRDYIVTYQHNIVALQQQVLLVKAEQDAFEKSVWLFILNYLLTDRGSHFNRKMFVQSTLLQLADYYNQSFADMLALFTTALHQQAASLPAVDSLQHIIYELTQERTAALAPVVPLRTSLPAMADEVAQTAGQLEWFRYFLLKGAWPFGAPACDAQQFTQLFMVLAERVPAAMKAIVIEAGQQEAVRQRMAGTLPEVVLKKIVQLEEQAQATFIFAYVQQVQVQYRQQALLKTTEKDFHKTVWEFVLAYLLTARGSVFNTRMFLKSHITQLAQRYQVSYLVLLDFLTQQVNKAGSTPEASSLGRLLLQLQGEWQQQAVTGTAFVAEEQLPATTAATQQGQGSLYEILYYWLHHGHYPWWADQMPAQADEAWLLLQQQQPELLVQLWQYAGTDPVLQQRLVYQLSIPAISGIFKSLPGGAHAIEAYTFLLQRINTHSTLQWRYEQIWQPALLLEMWQVLAAGHYRQFNTVTFLQKAIQWLAAWSGWYPQRVLNALLQDGAPALAGMANSSYTSLLQLQQLFNDAAIDLLNQRITTGSLPDIEWLLQAYGRSQQGQVPASLHSQAIYLLQYYLQHQRLPVPFAALTSTFTATFLKKLMSWLQQQPATDWPSIWQNARHQLPAKQALYGLLLQEQSAEDAGIRASLKKQLLADTLHQWQTGTNKGIGTTTLLEWMTSYLAEHPSGSHLAWLHQQLQQPLVVEQLAQALTLQQALVFLQQVRVVPADNDRAWVQSLHKTLLSRIGYAPDQLRFNTFFTHFVLQYFLQTIHGTDRFTFITAWLVFIAQRETAMARTLEVFLVQTAGIELGLSVAQQQALQQYLQEKEAVAKKQQVLQQAAQQAGRALLQQEATSDAARKQRALVQQEIEQQQALLPPPENNSPAIIYLRNAGLVLVHPLLTALFNRLQWLDKGQFVNDAIQGRAVHLLQYMVTGKEQTPEHELVLNKVLCGMPIAQPIPVAIELTAAEKDTARELLHIVLQRWEKMHNTSVEGLQAAFLQREGALSIHAEGWELRVEPRGIDVLLPYLPWGFGMIKTSWMTKILTVTWT